jgi:2-keto-4-pentenoate hydratase
MSDLYETVARQLRDAYTSGVIPPLRDTLAPNNAEGAYAVQAINTKIGRIKGAVLSGERLG